jgi:hypothetical protein
VQSAVERAYPFDMTVKHNERRPSQALRGAIERYRAADADWRLIDDQWLGEVEGLALYLDSYTNNSSLAIAVELVQSGKVLLFAADAQIGNWDSWSGIEWQNGACSTDDLLARTVLYKVGHHGSHNATLVRLLEKMRHEHLCALIPVHKQDPNITKANGWKMPARNLLTRLIEKTSGRVLQMDGVQDPRCDRATSAVRDAWAKTGIKLKQTELYFELGL